MFINNVYEKLEKRYGNLEWWKTDNCFEVFVGAILTQNTNWVNVEKALLNLKDFLTPSAILGLEIEKLQQLIRPSGYFVQKAERLKIIAQFFLDKGEDYLLNADTKKLRIELLSLKGVGNETADSMLLYGLDKPSFIIDAYTRRIFHRLGFAVPKKYDDFREMFMAVLEKDYKLYARYHGYIVELAKSHCTKKNPDCVNCPLADICKKEII